jgi:hypothetical protein
MQCHAAHNLESPGVHRELWGNVRHNVTSATTRAAAYRAEKQQPWACAAGALVMVAHARSIWTTRSVRRLTQIAWQCAVWPNRQPCGGMPPSRHRPVQASPWDRPVVLLCYSATPFRVGMPRLRCLR